MDTHGAYQAALDYMYSFINYETRMPSSPAHARFNLDRMHRLLALLDDPQAKWPSVIVAGTKGKGSTAAMIEALVRAAGLRTGLFSSPHLHSWRERIQVDRILISQADVVRLVERVKQCVARLPDALQPPTVFELATAVAFVYFAEQRVDLAVLEVGMGGRYDTTNVVTPRVSVVTPISFDHMALLGNTLTEIAGNKAGIIKPQVPVVSAVQVDEAATVIRAEARQQLAPLWIAEPVGLVGPDSTVPYPLVPREDGLGLRGAHQLENARIAIGTAMLLSDQGLMTIGPSLAAGLESVRWPGRFEQLADRPAIIVDGAMNAASAARLLMAVNSVPHRRLVLVLGTSADKDIAAIAGVLVPAADEVIATRSRHPRSALVEQVAAAVEPLLGRAPHVTPDIPEALELARQLATPEDLVCVTGSLFVVAAAREALGCPVERD